MRVRPHRVVRGVVAALVVGLTAALAGAASTRAVASATAIYDLPGTFRDESGATTTFARWRGTRLAVTMAYTSCQRVCPTTMQALRDLERRPADAGEPLEIAVVTLDPEHDTPTVLAAYKARQGITSPRWHFLTGARADVERVARRLGIAFVDPERHLFHTFKVVVFAPNGDVERTLDWDHRD